LNENNALDFDSLLTYTYKLLKENPDLLEFYQSKFKYIHIDEFQDTNTVQYDLAKLLAGKHKNIFVVGDEDQCIYTWRGANSKNLNKFKRDFENVELIKLEQNYRSTKKILEAANKLIEYNQSRIEKNLWTENDSGVKIDYYSPFNEKEEAFEVAQKIRNLISRGHSYSDFGILMRLNSLTRNFEDILLEFNIPYRIFGGMKFYDRLEIKNILSYLKILYNKNDENSFYRIINYPKRGIGEKALQKFRQGKPDDLNSIEYLLSLDEENTQIPKQILGKFLKFKSLYLDLEEKLQSKNLDDFISYVISKSGIFDFYADRTDEASVSRKYNISEYITTVKEWVKKNPDAKLGDYLHSITLITDIDTYDEGEEAVTISTVHSVKGLEFRNVFIVGAEEDIFPLRRGGDMDIEEERRLMYVAMTRAQERLYITSTKQRYLYGNSKYMMPSRFLDEAGIISNEPKEEKNLDYSGSFNVPLKGANYEHTQTKINQTTDKEKNEVINNIKLNDKVSHPKFGNGTVISLSGTNKNKTARIQFNGLGTKTLALNFAPIEIID
ncbi:MAG: ATP-dependent helicase, partial [Halanaerobiales bacterium]